MKVYELMHYLSQCQAGAVVRFSALKMINEMPRLEDAPHLHEIDLEIIDVDDNESGVYLGG